MHSDSSDVADSTPNSNTAAEPSTSDPTLGDRPSQRIQIGSQRDSGVTEAKPKPVTPAGPPPVKKKEPKHYPPPNIRDQLSPEMEAEFEAALGDLSFDALMQSRSRQRGGARAAAGSARHRPRRQDQPRRCVRRSRRPQSGRRAAAAIRRQPPAEGAEVELLVVRFDADEGLYELSRPTAAVDVGNWDEVREGQIVEVTVTGSNKGGLECQIAGIRGFIPMGQVSIYRVENPEEFVGQRLACVVTEANRDRRNLVLSHRAVMERERNEKRDKLLAELAPGQIREGIVRSLKDFGAFVDLGGVDGLIHVSQLSWDRVKHPERSASKLARR